MTKFLLALALCAAAPQEVDETADVAEAARQSSRESTRKLLIAVMIGLPSISILLLVVSGIQLKAFESRVPRIQKQADLDEFKAFVKTQMHLALVAMPILYLSAAVFPAGFLLGPLELVDLLYSVIPAILVIACAQILKRVEKRVQTLPVSEELRHHRDVVVDKWKASPLPDW